MDTTSHIESLSKAFESTYKELKSIEADGMDEFKDKKEILSTIMTVKSYADSISAKASSVSEESKMRFIQESERLLKTIDYAISEYKEALNSKIKGYRDE